MSLDLERKKRFWEEYEDGMRRNQELEEAEKEGYEDGLKFGEALAEEQTKKRIVFALLADGFDIDVIAKYTDTWPDTILEWRDQKHG